MKDETKDILKIWVFIIIVGTIATGFFYCVISRSTDIIYETGCEEKTYNGTIYDIKLTDFKLTIIFNDGFYLTFNNPSQELINHYPYLDSIESNYADLIFQKGKSIEIHYIHSSFDGCNYI